MVLAALGTFAPLFLGAAVAYGLARRDDIPASARASLAGAHALAALALATAIVAVAPEDAPGLAAGAIAGPVAVLLLALAASGASRRARAVVGILALALALALLAGSLARASAAVALPGGILLAIAVALPLARPARSRHETASALAWTPAAIALGAESAAGAMVAGVTVVEAATALATLGLLALAARATRSWTTGLALVATTSLAAAAIGGLAGAGAIDRGWMIAPLALAPSALALALLRRDRALGATSRPLAATAAAYATSFAALALAPGSREAAAVAALAVGGATLAVLEAVFPELDEARARANALARAEARARESAIAAASLGPGARVLGRYRIAEVLGEGSFGTAYRAEDEVTGETVVVKALRTERATDAAFLREARAIATVRHPNVVELKDVVSDERGSFLVLEYVDGGSLADRLARGPLARSEAGRVAEGVLAALEAVHAAGLVHADVKPSNVLLAASGAARPLVAKLADFGVARAPGEEATLGTAAFSAPVGTLRYMAPEVARGRKPSRASDVYAAAATIYEAYRGEPLVAARTNESAIELQIRVASESRGLDRPFDGPPALRAWLERALAPDPRDRFEGGAEARAALALALAAAR